MGEKEEGKAGNVKEWRKIAFCVIAVELVPIIHVKIKKCVYFNIETEFIPAEEWT